jgi:hypothetical protein
MELMQASHQWATRPADERFTSLTDLLAHVKHQREQSVQRVMPNRQLLASPIEGDRQGLALINRRDDTPALPSNWAFSQLCSVVGAPSKYLRTLPPELAADCLNLGLQTRDVEELGVMVRQNGGPAEVRAVTGPNYGRIWNAEIVTSLVRRFGDGVTGAFKVPGEFGRAVEITKDNTTLYAGDRDMFVFLADEVNRIEIPNRRNGQSGSLARGFFVWNSEVGAATLGIASFLFDYACSNRIVWGAEGFKEIRIRHTSGAPHRWLENVMPALKRYAESSSEAVVSTIVDAQAKKIGDAEKVDAFLAQRFTRPQVKAIKLAHEAEEQRPIETLWDVATGATAYARSIEYQDDRVDIERKAGAVLNMAR